MRTFLTALSICILSSTAQAAPFRIHPYNFFGAAEEFTASIALGDLDGDGDLDGLAVNGRHWVQQDRAYFNNGLGLFRTAAPVGAREGTGYVAALADFDGDGDLDAVIARDLLPALMVRNDGHGNFDAGEEFGPMLQARSALAGDLDNDGDIDLVISLRGDVNILYLNDGSGQLEPTAAIGGEYQTIGGAMADLDNDGDLDLIFSNRGGEGVLVHLNDGEAGFDAGRFIGAELDLETRAIAMGDMNDDGHLDIVAAAIGAPGVIFHGDGAGGFTPADRWGIAEDRTYGLALADFDADGQLDILAGNTQTPSQIHYQSEQGWYARDLYDDVETIYSVAIGDMNADRKPDIVFAVSEGVNFIALNQHD